MGMKSTRMSRKVHSTQRMQVKQESMVGEAIRGSEHRDGSVLRDREGGPYLKNSWPQFEFPTTPRPRSNERPTDGGTEGIKKSKHTSRQSSKSK